jgi:hypothetical protein
MTTAAAARPSDATPIAPNVQPVPRTDATPPSTGPNKAPATAIAKARPISEPRFSAGEPATSHASAPVHENAPAKPCRKRAASSSQACVSIPNTTMQTATVDIPATHRRLHADSRRHDPARHRPEERPRGIRGRENARAGLADVERVDVVRQQRRQGRVEERVHEDNGAGENQETSHAASG